MHTGARNVGSISTFWRPRVESDSERHAEAMHHVSTSHEAIELIKYSTPKTRHIASNQVYILGDSGTNGVRSMCHTRWTTKVDALGNTTSNCTVPASIDVGWHQIRRAWYGNEGTKSRCYVSNEHIPLPVWDHAGRAVRALKHIDNLNRTQQQHKSLLPAEGQRVVSMTVEMFKWIRGGEQL